MFQISCLYMTMVAGRGRGGIGLRKKKKVSNFGRGYIGGQRQSGFRVLGTGFRIDDLGCTYGDGGSAGSRWRRPCADCTVTTILPICDHEACQHVHPLSSRPLHIRDMTTQIARCVPTAWSPRSCTSTITRPIVSSSRTFARPSARSSIIISSINSIQRT